MNKYCEECGLRADISSRVKTDQFKCSECGHMNISKTKELLAEKLSLFEHCKLCTRVIKGKIIRKKDSITTIKYFCEWCSHEWTEKWQKKTIKERLNAVGKKQ